jgi:RimJ/RimL family protein N-acetyltransferase
MRETGVMLRRWSTEDLPLLEAVNTAKMTQHLGGPETDEEVRERHARYLRLNDTDDAWMFRIEVDGEPAGGIGFWPIEHDNAPAYETGWNVLPPWQGRGVAREALRVLLRFVADEAPHRDHLYAYPDIGNAASNALCRSAGFADLGAREFPYRDAVLHVRVWELDLTPLSLDGRQPEVDERFGELDPARWWPYYTPHWSSRAHTGARYEVDEAGLVLRIDADTEPWAPEIDGDVRVSHLQTGQLSGAVGSARGQHRFRDGLVVREEQPRHGGWLVRHGVIAARFAAIRHPAAMVALWPLGFEEHPDDCGEICIAEIFGSEMDDAGGWVGVGVKAQRDPRLRTDFDKVPVRGDLTALHEYAVEWTPERLRFFIDGRWVKTVGQRIDYPVQMMIDVYELPGDGPRDVSQHPLLFRVERVATYPPA